MRNVEIESKVLAVADKVLRGEPVEDATVELKSRWIDPRKAARQVAGHCNAVRGPYVLWIVGIDEEAGVVGAANDELADWTSSFKAQFSEVAPDIYDLNVSVGEFSVVALLFSADRAPYVVKNEAGGHIQYEVPWREGRSTRSARRSDLIRTIGPHLDAPFVQPLGAALTVSTYSNKNPVPEMSLKWNVFVELYLVPANADRLVVPFHECYCDFILGGFKEATRIQPAVRSLDQSNFMPQGPDYRNQTISDSRNELLVTGPGGISVQGTRNTGDITYDPTLPIRIRFRMRPAGHERAVALEFELAPLDALPDNTFYSFDMGGKSINRWSRTWLRRDFEDFE